MVQSRETDDSRYNSAISSTFPLNSPAIVVVTPDFLSEGFIDPNATRATAAQRANMVVSGMQQIPPRKIVNSTLGASWGRVGFVAEIADDCYVAGGCGQFQRELALGSFSHFMSPVDCLTAYVSPTGNRSDLIIVSTYDMIANIDPKNNSNNSLLYTYGAFRFGGPGNYWECGNSNDFDC